MTPSSSPSFLDDCLNRRIIFFTGKGGVGKSTLSWATALAASRRGLDVAVASWNPYDEQTRPPLDEFGRITYYPLETLSAFKEYVVKILKFETIYDTVFDNPILKTFLRAAPGLSETVLAGKIWNMADRKDHDLIIVDLPSSGHAYSFFQSPHGVQKVFGMGFVRREAERICQLFESSACRIDLVTLPEELPVAECAELKLKLSSIAPFRFGFLHLNQTLPEIPIPNVESDFVERFRLQKDQEADSEGALRALHMPLIKHPNLTLLTATEMTLALAKRLETA